MILNENERQKNCYDIYESSRKKGQKILKWNYKGKQIALVDIERRQSRKTEN